MNRLTSLRRPPAQAAAETAAPGGEPSKGGLLPTGRLSAIGAQASVALSRPSDASERQARQLGQALGEGRTVGPVTPVQGHQIQAAGGMGGASVPTARLAGLASGGRPLPGHQRAFYASRLGAGAAAANLHQGPAADGVMAGLRVRGLSMGNQVAVRSDRYDAASPDGGATLRHEMIHAAQHHAAGPQAAPILQGEDDEDMTGDNKGKKAKSSSARMEDETPFVQLSQRSASAPVVFSNPSSLVSSLKPIARSLSEAPTQSSIYHVPQQQLQYHAPQQSLYHAPQQSLYHQPQQSLYHLPQQSLYHPSSALPPQFQIPTFSQVQSQSLPQASPNAPRLPFSSPSQTFGQQPVTRTQSAPMIKETSFQASSVDLNSFGKRTRNDEPQTPVDRLVRSHTAPSPMKAKRKFEEDLPAPKVTTASMTDTSASSTTTSAVMADENSSDEVDTSSMNKKARTKASKGIHYTHKLAPHAKNATAFVDLVAKAANLQTTDVEGMAIWKTMWAHADALDTLDRPETTAVQKVAKASGPVKALLLKAGINVERDFSGEVDESSQVLLVQAAALMERAAKAKTIPSDARVPVHPIFGAVNSKGMGRFAAIEVSRGTTLATGSKASGTETKTPWQDTLSHRRWGRSAVNLYIRGHLLNDHVGGPSTPPNLVPLIGARNLSGPATNQLHEAKVESRLKQALWSLDHPREGPEDVIRVVYGAKAGGKQPSRARGKKSVVRAQSLFLGMAKHLGVKTDAKMPVFEKALRAKMKEKDPRTGAPTSDAAKLGTAWFEICPALGAITGLAEMNILNISTALADNLKLWEFEDTYVPAALHLTLQVDRKKQGLGKGPVEPFTLDNTVPDDARLMRYRPTASLTSEPDADELADESDDDGDEVEDTSANVDMTAPISPLQRGRNYLPGTRPLKPGLPAKEISSNKLAPSGNYARYVFEMMTSFEKRSHADMSDEISDQASEQISKLLNEAYEAALTLDSVDAKPNAYGKVKLKTVDRGLLTHVTGSNVTKLLQELIGATDELEILAEGVDFQTNLADLHDKLEQSNLPPPKEGKTARPGAPLFGATTSVGMGSWAMLVATPDTGMPHGSSASGTATKMDWYDVLDHRGWRYGKVTKGRRDVGNLYIRGHLLNDHLGGPSAPYNLVPLVGAASLAMSKVNTEHEVAMESTAKEAIAEMDTQTQEPDDFYMNDDHRIAYVAYSTAVTKPTQPKKRQGTTLAEAALATFKTAAPKVMNDTVLTPSAKLDAMSDKAPPPPTKTPIHNAHENMALHSLWQAVGDDAASDVLYRVMQQIGAPSQFSYKDMGVYLAENAKLWAYEEAYVPQELKVSLKIQRKDNTTAAAKTYPLHNLLPDDADHMMYRP